MTRLAGARAAVGPFACVEEHWWLAATPVSTHDASQTGAGCPLEFVARLTTPVVGSRVSAVAVTRPTQLFGS